MTSQADLDKLKEAALWAAKDGDGALAQKLAGAHNVMSKDDDTSTDTTE